MSLLIRVWGQDFQEHIAISSRPYSYLLFISLLSLHSYLAFVQRKMNSKRPGAEGVGGDEEKTRVIKATESGTVYMGSKGVCVDRRARETRKKSWKKFLSACGKEPSSPRVCVFSTRNFLSIRLTVPHPPPFSHTFPVSLGLSFSVPLLLSLSFSIASIPPSQLDEEFNLDSLEF